jgi:hypothetical protein
MMACSKLPGQNVSADRKTMVPPSGAILVYATRMAPTDPTSGFR